MTNLAQFDKTIAQQLLESSDAFPVDFDVAWEWLGYARKDLAKRNFLSCNLQFNFVEGIDYEVIWTKKKSRMYHSFMLSVNCFRVWGKESKTDQGKLVQIYFLEAESIAHLKKEKEIQSQKLAKIESLICQYYSDIDCIYQSPQEVSVKIWCKIINILEPLTTRELLKNQCTLIEFDGEIARIGISSENLLKLVQGKLTNLQAAFNLIFPHEIKVTLEVASSRDKYLSLT